jgi:hypothetical protein
MAIVAAERSKRRPAFSLWPIRPEALRSALRAGFPTRLWRSLGLREGPLPRSGNLPVQRTGISALKAASVGGLFHVGERGTEARCQFVTGGGQVPPFSGRAENIFPHNILKREGSLDAALWEAWLG